MHNNEIGKTIALKQPINPWRKHDYVEAASKALTDIFVVPNVGTLDMSSGIDWWISFPEANKSKRLWFHSLPFVYDCVAAAYETNNSTYAHKAVSLIKNYRDWYEHSNEAWELAWDDDHTVANRSCVVTFALFHAEHGNIPVTTEDMHVLRQSFLDHGNWIYEDKNFRLNNHGMMASRALLQAALLVSIWDDELAVKWRDKALDRLVAIANMTFDHDGCCTENSPSYHMLNVNLYVALLMFLRDHGLAEHARELQAIVTKAENVAPLFLRSDATVALVGDSQSELTQYLPPKFMEKRFGKGVFPGAGFVIVNGEDYHFTLKCGGTGNIHRHIDDTSITLRLKDKDLIVDSGLYSYEAQKPIRQWLLSYLSHSGFYTEGFRGMRLDDLRGAILQHHIGDEELFVECENTALPGVRITRSVNWSRSNIIVIRDKLSATSPQKWRQQFVLHPECHTRLRHASAVVSRGDVAIEIVQSMSHGSWSLEEGWYSSKFLELSETKTLVYKGTGQEVELLTVITPTSGQSLAT